MKDEVLQMLRRCYESSREPVLLMDEDWNVLWSTLNPGVGYLPALLGVMADSWESCTRILRLGQNRYECSLVCNEQDGIRIAVLRQPESYIIPIDTEIVSNAMSTINLACSELYRVRPENADMLRTITGSCLKIYRMAYLQKELERWQAGFWERNSFSVKTRLVQLQERIEDVLGDTTDVTLQMCEEDMYLNADVDAFSIVMLSAVVLCYHEPEMRQELEICMDKADNTLLLTVSMNPTPEDRYDHKNRLGEFGIPDAEQMLLNAFCKEYGGHWIKNTSGDTVTCRIELPASESTNYFTMNSPLERSESRFFNKYEILLARIQFRGSFL